MVWEVVDHFTADYHYTISINRPSTILKAEMVQGMSVNGTTSLSGYSLFPWELIFQFIYKSA